jgi:hypothetical protein
MCSVDDVGAGDAGEKVLGATRETGDFVGEDGTTDKDMVIVEEKAIERNRNRIMEEAFGK